MVQTKRLFIIFSEGVRASTKKNLTLLEKVLIKLRIILSFCLIFVCVSRSARVDGTYNAGQII